MSGAIDEDTAETVAEGRAALGSFVVSARSHLRKVFVVWVAFFLGTIYFLMAWGWEFLKDVTEKQMTASVAEEVEIIALTPFDVILLQVKIGAIVGIIFALPVLLYYSRDGLKARGMWPTVPVARWKVALLGLLSLLLLAGGIVYGYFVFFPVMFNFLATNAINAEIQPKYSIVKHTEFIFFLTLSFGLAAQLPLAMSGLSYTGIVRYETFRDKWRYAIVGIFAFGALFSPPDPFTQLMWATPLIVLYGLSLYLAKVVVTLKRGSDEAGVGGILRRRAPQIAGAGVLGGGAAYAAVSYDAVGWVNATLLPALPSAVRPGPLPTVPALLGLDPTPALAVVTGVAALVTVVLASMYAIYDSLDASGTPPPASPDPADVDVADLDEAGVRAAPDEVFADMTEEQALGHAQRAMDEDDPDRAQAILDRYDAVAAAEGADGEAEAADEAGEAAATGEAAAGEGAAAGEAADDAEREVATAEAPGARASRGDDGDVVTETATGVVNAFTDEETTEDDIGGWYYDLQFIFESLTSKMFRIAGVFIGVMAVVFFWLYSGGLGQVKASFLRSLPAEVRPDDVDVIALHPVEALIFEVKISVVIGAVAVLPMVLYHAWPALQERGLVSGDRRIFFGWGGAVVAGLVGGSALGFGFIAPALISYLVSDSIQAGMVIFYRINNFMWLVVFTTVGIGLLADVPVTMVLFYFGGIASYRTMRGRWREVTIASFVAAALFTPATTLSMFLVAIPTMLAYWVGLGLLWLLTLGGRREKPPGRGVGEDDVIDVGSAAGD